MKCIESDAQPGSGGAGLSSQQLGGRGLRVSRTSKNNSRLSAICPFAHRRGPVCFGRSLLLWQLPLDMEARPASWYHSITQGCLCRYQIPRGNMEACVYYLACTKYEIDVAWDLSIAGQGDNKQNQYLSETGLIVHP